MSSERSATSRFNRLLSSSNGRSRRSSLTAQVGILLFPGVEGGVTDPELSVEVTDGGCRFRPVDSRTRSVPPRTVTASWVRSFRQGPPRPSSYSRYDLPLFSRETSVTYRTPAEHAVSSFSIGPFVADVVLCRTKTMPQPSAALDFAHASPSFGICVRLLESRR